MKIESKFNIGDRVWVVYEYDSEIRVYSDYITEILIKKENEIRYWLENTDCDNFKESALIPYNNIDLLTLTIKFLDNKIINEKVSMAGE